MPLVRAALIVIVAAALAAPAAASSSARRKRPTATQKRKATISSTARRRRVPRLRARGNDGRLRSTISDRTADAVGNLLERVENRQKALHRVKLDRKTRSSTRRAIRRLRAGKRNLDALRAQGADPHLDEVQRYSESGGEYFVVSDLHWGPGRNEDGEWDATEEFQQSHAFARFIGHMTRRSSKPTLVLGGDWIEIARFADADSHRMDVSAIIRRAVRGHAREARALARAVVRHGLRVIYIRGNHDVHLVDPAHREVLTGAIIEVAGLSAAEANTFRKRFAWGGFGAIIGRYGEGLVTHGDVLDATNNWRSPVNPYTATRELESSFGWGVIAHLVRKIASPNAEPLDSHEKARAAGRLLFSLVRQPGTFRELLREIFPSTRGRRGTAALAEILDDRVAMRSWISRSGFDRRMQRKRFDGDRPIHWPRAIEQEIYELPPPLLSRFTNPIRIVTNTLAAAWNALRVRSQEKRALRFVDRMTRLGNLRYLIWGHDHRETALVREHRSKEKIGHLNSGTWTLTRGEWRLNVVVLSTNDDGTLEARGPGRGIHRVDVDSGVPVKRQRTDLEALVRQKRPQ